MIDGFDPAEIVACALRPAGSWMHFSALAGFVLASWWLSPVQSKRTRRVR
jgi:membrane associated rhomboid family serine protease